MTGEFIKRYPGTAARAHAYANYRWLSRFLGPGHLPELRYSGARELRFEHVAGRHAVPSDLTMLAGHLGDVHGSAYAAELHLAQLSEPYRAAGGQVLPAFARGRLEAIGRELTLGHVPGVTLTTTEARHLIAAADGPAAFYKDANPRNFLITPAGFPVTIDFDDLTLAPFGYDLAKLIVTLAMTHGPLADTAITDALAAYNRVAACRCAMAFRPVSREDLMNWAEIHHILTSRYSAGGRYPHRWNELRPG